MKLVGNNLVLARYITLKAELIPNRDPRIKIGIEIEASSSFLKCTEIIKPIIEKAAIENEKNNARLVFSLLNTSPDNNLKKLLRLKI